MRRLLTVVLLALLGVGAAFGSHAYFSQRNRIEELSNELTALQVSERSTVRRDRSELARAQLSERSTTASLATAEARLSALEVAATSTTTTTAPVVALTDPQVLVDDLTQAFAQIGDVPSAAQDQAFITQIHDEEIEGAQFAAEGKPDVVVDPTSEAQAFVEDADPVGVITAGSAAWGNYLQCIVNGNCNG